MIVKKEITATAEKLDDVVLELAEEIKKGYTIKGVTFNDDAISRMTIREPTFTVKLERVGGHD